MTRKYELVVIDLDGTLVDAAGNISKADISAVKAAQAAGTRVAIATGRVIDACRRHLRELELGGAHIFFDGALVYDISRGETIYAQPIKPQTLKSAVNFASANDIYLELYALDRYFVKEITWADEIHRQFFGLKSTLADLDDIASHEMIIKCELMIHNDKEETQANMFMDNFKGLLCGTTARTPAYPEMKFVNVVDPAVSKGSGLEQLSGHLGIGLDRVLAIGDGTNDLTLLEKAGFKVAMGNARDELKAVADHVTLSVEDSGVAAAIKRFIL